MRRALIVPDKKKLLIRDEHPTRITTVIPTSKIITYRGVDLVVMPHGLDEVRVMNNLGYSIQSPVSHYYKWSGRYTPFHAQRVTADKLTLNNRMFVLNDLGTGKTLSALWAFDYLRSIGAVKKMLIVTPLSTMERVWSDEVFHHFPHLETMVLYGTSKQRVAKLEYPADIYIINHDGLKVPEICAALVAKDDIDVVTVDELASFRNASTDRWKALRQITEGRPFVWGMTGTPIPNRPTDAWAQCRLIAPSRVPPYFGRFREMVERKVSQFKWVPRDNALQTVQEAMQPSVLFRRDECVDLPPTMYEQRYVEMSADQKRAYKQMMLSLVAEAQSGQIVAVNEAVKAAKLAQIACISHDTPVLCDRGWVPIQDVVSTDLVWDGVEWVCQGGVVPKGLRPVIDCCGIHMTPDHKVLSTDGWITAEEMTHGYASGRFKWEKVRPPDSHPQERVYKWEDKVRSLGLPLRLWLKSNKDKSVFEKPSSSTPPKLWLPSWERDSQNERFSPVQRMVWNAKEMLKSARQRLEKLWWARDNGVSRVGPVIPSILGRHACRISGAPDARQSQQQSGVQQRELPMEHCIGAGQQQKDKSPTANSRWGNDSISSRGSLWTIGHNVRCSYKQVRMERRAGPYNSGTREEAVYDLVNCGPRNRFVVKSASGELRIVHNCGVAYDQEGKCIRFDCEERIAVLKEVIEESAGKVIIFVPLTGGLEMIAEEIGKHWQTEVVHGGVGKNERDRIFGEFQRPGGLHVIVAHPKCMAHGLTLVEANTIVWFIPTNNHEDYVQANGRIVRPGQKRNTLILHIEGSEVEKRMYKRLQGKSSMQNLLLDMIKERLE